MLFRDRADAGRQLAEKLAHYANRDDVVVLGLPRGGIPVAFEVAVALHAPLDVFVVRKLGVPWQQELAMGAIATGGIRILNEDVIRELRITQQQLDLATAKESRTLERNERRFRGDRAPLELEDRVVILVDDGLATGSTMRAAVQALRRMKPQRLIVGVPVGASETCREFQEEVDECVCVRTPEPFQAVGLWYEDFSQTTDEEVCELLERAGEGAVFSGDGG